MLVGNVVMFKGSADLGQRDGGVYDWIGRANADEFVRLLYQRRLRRRVQHDAPEVDASRARPSGGTGAGGRFRSDTAWRPRCASRGNCTRRSRSACRWSGRPRRSTSRPICPEISEGPNERAGLVLVPERWLSERHHDAVEDRHRKGREAAQVTKAQENAQRGDQDEGRDHFAHQHGRRGVTLTGDRGAERDASAHGAPRE